MKPTLDDWTIGTFFGMQAMAGYDQDGRRIVRPFVWTSHGSVGLLDFGPTVTYRLGRPGPGMPRWMEHAAFRAWIRERDKP